MLNCFVVLSLVLDCGVQFFVFSISMVIFFHMLFVMFESAVSFDVVTVFIYFLLH